MSRLGKNVIIVIIVIIVIMLALKSVFYWKER